MCRQVKETYLSPSLGRERIIVINGMTPEEHERLQAINRDLGLINGIVGIEHQAWDDRYIASIDADLLIELVTVFNLVYAQIKAVDGPQMRMMISGRFLADDPIGKRQTWIDTVERADEMIARINKPESAESR